MRSKKSGKRILGYVVKNGLGQYQGKYDINDPANWGPKLNAEVAWLDEFDDDVREAKRVASGWAKRWGGHVVALVARPVPGFAIKAELNAVQAELEATKQARTIDLKTYAEEIAKVEAERDSLREKIVTINDSKTKNRVLDLEWAMNEIHKIVSNTL